MPSTNKKRPDKMPYAITVDGKQYHALYVINDELVVPLRKRELKNRIGFSSVVSRAMTQGHTVLYVPLGEYREAVRQRERAGVEAGSPNTHQWDYQHLRVGTLQRRRSTSLAGTGKKTPARKSAASCGVSPDVRAAAYGTAAGKSKSARVLAGKGKREARKRAAAGCRAPGYVPVSPARKKLVLKGSRERLQLINEATRKLYDKPGNKKTWAACTKQASTQLKRAGQL